MALKNNQSVRSICVLTAVCGLSLALGGCMGQGKANQEHVSAAKAKMNLMKGAVEQQMAHDQFMAGDLDKALRSVDKSISLAPDSPKAWVLRGRIQLERSDVENARLSLLEAEKLEPENVDAQYYLGIVYERFSQPEAALARYQKAQELDPSHAQYVVAGAEMLIAMAKFDEAEAMLATKSESLAHNAAIRQTQGQLMMLRGNPAKACTAFIEARLLAPDDLSITEDLVQAQMASGAFADAEFNITALQKAKGNENRRDLLQLKSRCLIGLERYSEARSILSNITADDQSGKDLQNWIALGNVCVRLEDWGRVRQVASRVVATAPDRTEGYLLRAQAQRAEGDAQGAIATLQKAARIPGKDTSALIMLAMVQIDKNNLGDAKAALAEAMVRNPKDTSVQQLLQGLEQGRFATVPTDEGH